jgi:parallel beta-helix repeat protein
LKLSKAPNMRTVIIAVLAFILIGTAVDAFAKELRVVTPNNLIECTKGVPLSAPSPDAGKAAAQGDTCVVLPGTYAVDEPVVIVVENLTLRSSDGPTATLIKGSETALIIIVNRGVTLGGASPNQGFSISNADGVAVCVTELSPSRQQRNECDAPSREELFGEIPNNLIPAVPASENITIQNNVIHDSAQEGILFIYNNITAIDTIRILRNEITGNGGDGLSFSSTVGAIGRRGQDRNVVIDGNLFNANCVGDRQDRLATDGSDQCANIHFFNSTTIEQLAILNNKIFRAGAGVVGEAERKPNDEGGDGILFDGPITEIRDSLIDRNLIQFNARNGIKFDYAGRLGENVIISNNKGVTPEEGITHNGPESGLVDGAEGNGILITALVTEVRGLTIMGNAINSNRGRNGERTSGVENRCKDGNGVAIENSGRLEDFTFQGNDVRLNFNNGVCIANAGDFSRSSVSNNTFHNNGTGDLQEDLGAPFGDGFAVYHDSTITEDDATNGWRIENITFSGNDYRENGDVNPQSGLGFGLHLRVERAEISNISLTNETALRNYLGGIRFATDTDEEAIRSGDIRQITLNNVQANENQGDPRNEEAADFDSLDNGDGIAFLTDNGDIDFVTATNVTASQNGGFGFRIESDGTAGDKPEEVSVTMGDIDTIKVSNSTFDFNGDRAAVGRGSGLMMASETIRTVTVTNVKANNNNDHGVQVTGNRNVSNVTVDGGQFNNNDRNRDTIGDGVQVNANEDMSNITVSNAEASSNYGGIRLGAVGRQIGQNLTVSGNTANNNVKEGIAFLAGRDLIKGEVTKNTLEGNGTGLDITVIARGSNISVTGNEIKGKDGQGIGILLNATGVTISGNQIRNNATGIEVRKNRENAINNNNIARNESYGINANALAPGEVIDATNNWWGEPSGPKHGTNPGGIGDRVTDKVNFKPFLDKPAVGTASNFVVESLTADKDDVNTGDTVNFKFVIRNNGDEEGIQDVKFVIKDGLGNVVDSRDMQITVNPQGRREATFSFVFQTPGEYTVTVSADASSKSVKVTVSGRGTCLPFALDNNPKNQKIDDAEIITAIDLWVRGGAVPGCTPPVTISDTQIIQLIDLWVKGSQLTVPLGGKMTSQSATLSVASTFATLGASVRAVRPGDSFTVTVNVDAKDGISGLLLSQALPAGWSAKPIQMSGAYYKASETKWLWLNAKGTVSVSYEVTVPATAQPGLYTIAGRVKAAVPGIESELQPLTVEVLGAPVALAVKAITLSQQPVRTSGAYFIVEGVGIAQTTVRVFSLTGKLVFSQTAQGNVVPFSAAAELANGVYFYVVTVQGADGQTVTSKLAKLVVLR